MGREVCEGIKRCKSIRRTALPGDADGSPDAVCCRDIGGSIFLMIRLRERGNLCSNCTDGDAFLYHTDETIVTISGSGTAVLVNDYMPVVPVITTTAENTLRWSIEGESFQKTISAGAWEIPKLELRHGNNTVSVTSEWTTTFVYRVGRL